jgi:hypothetical protein
MTADDFEQHLRQIGFTVEQLTGADNDVYTVIRDFEVPTGALQDKRCDVAMLRVSADPYVVPSAIHTRPALVAMDGSEPVVTQGSGIGPEWQYWSRRFDHTPTPTRIWAHVLTVLCDPRWVPA